MAMPTDVQAIDRIKLTIAKLSTFKLKLDDDLRVVILFSLLGLMISFALIALSGAEFASDLASNP
jgi:hypothetical protein